MGEAVDSPPQPGAGGRQAGWVRRSRRLPQRHKGSGGGHQAALKWPWGRQAATAQFGGREGSGAGKGGRTARLLSSGGLSSSCSNKTNKSDTNYPAQPHRPEMLTKPEGHQDLGLAVGRAWFTPCCTLPRPTAGARGLSVARSSSRPPREVTGPKQGPKILSEATRWRPGRVGPTSGHLEEVTAAGTPRLLV